MSREYIEALQTGDGLRLALELTKVDDINSEVGMSDKPYLIHAVDYQCLPAVQILIDMGADVNIKQSTGTTALHVAAYNGRVDILRVLVEAGADTEATDQRNSTPLIFAAKDEYNGVVDALISLGANVNACDYSDGTSLHYAALEGNVDIVKRLISVGDILNMNYINWEGNSALHYAAFRQHTEVRSLLLEAGADPTIENKKGYTAESIIDMVTQNKKLTWFDVL